MDIWLAISYVFNININKIVKLPDNIQISRI